MTRLALGSTSFLFSRYREILPRVEATRRENSHLPPSNAEVTNEWRYTSDPHVCLHSVDRDNFSFNGPYLLLRAGIVLCAEFALCDQASYGKHNS